METDKCFYKKPDDEDEERTLEFRFPIDTLYNYEAVEQAIRAKIGPNAEILGMVYPPKATI